MKKSFVAFTFLIAALQGYANGPVNADSATFYHEKAQQLSLASKIWEADQHFKKALAFNPSDNRIRIAYSNYLAGQRKYFNAVEQFGKVLESDLDNREALGKLTEISFLLRRWNDVIIYGNRLMQQKSDASIKYMFGKAYYEMENYGQARRYLHDAVAENNNNTEAVVLLGKVLIQLGEYRQAVSMYEKAIGLHADNKLVYDLGLLHYTLNNEREAVAMFEKAAEKGYKKDLAYYENLGLACLGFDMEKGIENLNKVLESKPGNAAILFQVAQAYFKNEKYKEAADAYYRVFENDPLNSRALFMTGVAYQKKGDKHRGVALCEQAIQLDPALAQFKTAKAIF